MRFFHNAAYNIRRTMENDPAAHSKIEVLPVSYTHLDVYKRQAFEYQEREVRKAYPSEKFSNRYNYYTTDMLIIYTMIMFVKRKDAVRYPLPKLNLEGLPLFYRLTYRLWVFIARMKFGRYLRIVSEGA